MDTFGVIGAMDSEVENLLVRMTQTHETILAGRRFVSGQLGGKPVVVVKSGIGKVAAAITAQLLIDRFSVTALLNTGMAGGLDSRLAVRDLVVGTAALQHDFDLTAFGHAPGYMTGDDDSRATLYRADPALTQTVLSVAPAVLPQESKAIPGIIASGDVFVDDTTLKKRLITQFDAAAAEMEGAAIAQTAAANGIPFVIVRVISDLAEHQANVSFDELEHYAGTLAGDITAALLNAV